MQFIDLKTQTKRIEERLMARFKAIMDSGAFIMGPEIVELEKQLAAFTASKHCLSVSSGTDALLIALMALGIKPGDEVITSPFSFFATAEVIALLGATPIFVDIDANNYNIDPNLIEAAISKKTRAIIPVNLYGQCADYDAINSLASKYNLAVIEDAAQSFGAKYKDRPSGGLSTIGCTSFFPSKPLGCFGDGGACFTNDDELAKRIAEIRNHGQSKRYLHTSLGINGRMDTMQAAVLLEKLSIFPEEIGLRQEAAKRYDRLLPAEFKRPKLESYNQHVYAQYTIEVEDRESVQQALEEQGIPTAVHYPLVLNQQPIFKAMYAKTNACPKAISAASRVMSLPMHPYLGEADQKKIAGALQAVIAETV